MLLAGVSSWLTASPQGWEEVKFDNFGTFDGCVDADKRANIVEPDPRASHAMVSAGVTALMCGGLGDGGIKLEAADGSIDCWWLTPVPTPRWDRLQLAAGSEKPSPRAGHSMGYDEERQIISIIGGQDKANNLVKVGSTPTRVSRTCFPLGRCALDVASELPC